MVMSGVRCRLFACGPADATAIPKPPSSLASFKSRLHRRPDPDSKLDLDLSLCVSSGSGLTRLTNRQGEICMGVSTTSDIK